MILGFYPPPPLSQGYLEEMGKKQQQPPNANLVRVINPNSVQWTAQSKGTWLNSGTYSGTYSDRVLLSPQV